MKNICENWIRHCWYAESHFRVIVRRAAVIESFIRSGQDESSASGDYCGGFGESGGLCGVAERLQVCGGLPADGRTHENARGEPRQGEVFQKKNYMYTDI